MKWETEPFSEEAGSRWMYWYFIWRICPQGRRHKRSWLDPRTGKIPWRRKWQTTPVFLPEKSYGQRYLVGYSPKSHKELNTTELSRIQGGTPQGWETWARRWRGYNGPLTSVRKRALLAPLVISPSFAISRMAWLQRVLTLKTWNLVEAPHLSS